MRTVCQFFDTSKEIDVFIIEDIRSIVQTNGIMIGMFENGCVFQ